MIVKTYYLPLEDLWAWTVNEGTTLVYVSPERYALKSNATKAGHDWIIDANKLIDTVNNKEQSQ